MRFSARTPILLGLISFLIAAGIVTIWYRLTPPPENIAAANLGATSFSVGWTTTKPTRGCAVAMADTPEFTFWDLLKSQFLRNYTGRYVNKTCFSEKFNTHLAGFTNLFDDMPYRVAVIVGPRRVELTFGNPVVTKKIDQTDEPPLPDPAYGSVIHEDETPATGVLIFIYRDLTDEFRYPLASVTNDDGNYAIDLANFDDSDDILPYDSYLTEVVDLDGKKQIQELPRAVHQPFPPIIIFR